MMPLTVDGRAAGVTGVPVVAQKIVRGWLPRHELHTQEWQLLLRYKMYSGIFSYDDFVTSTLLVWHLNALQDTEIRE